MVENAHHSEVGPHGSTVGAGGAAWGPVSRRSTHELVIDAIEDQIMSGALAVGDLLPPERELASRLQVSRTGVREAIRVLEATSAPHGFNLGMNQGEVAGAGVAAHLHQHVIPRWGGDMNFLPIIAQTKALPILLEDARDRLAQAWPDPA